MSNKEYLIDIDEARRPYNAYMVLPLTILQKLMPLLNNEILNGLVDSDQHDRVILHLLLEEHKIAELKKIVAPLNTKVQILHK